MKKIVLVSAILLSLGMSVNANAAGLVNSGFESGLLGWNAYGDASVVSEAFAHNGKQYNPVSGKYMASLKGGAANTYNTLSQNVSLQAGESLSGYAAYLGHDYMPFEDDAYVKIFQNGNEIAKVWSNDINQVGNYGDSSWNKWNWTAQNEGIYTVQYAVRNTIDNAGSPQVLFDTPVPEPATGLLSLIGTFAVGLFRKRNKQ